MRLRNDPILPLEGAAPKSSDPKIVRQHKEQYQRIGRILDERV